jgi:hypothetical protein
LNSVFFALKSFKTVGFKKLIFFQKRRKKQEQNLPVIYTGGPGAGVDQQYHGRVAPAAQCMQGSFPVAAGYSERSSARYERVQGAPETAKEKGRGTGK